MANKFNLTAQLVLTPPKNAGQVASQLQRQFKGINTDFTIKSDPRQVAAIQSGLRGIATESKRAKKEYSALTEVIGAGARRFAAITVVTSTFIGLTRSIKRSLGEAIEFQREMTVLAQVTGKTTGELKDLKEEVNRISKAFGVSSDGLLKTATTLSQAGFSARKVKDSLEVLAKTELAASFDNISDTTEGAIAILSQFRKESIKAGGDVKFLERSLGAINDVSKAFAVESDDLITAVRQTGGAFESAGGSLNELLGVFTSVRATTRESAETIATGLRTIFTRIQRVDTINALKQLGIELQDVEGKFVGPFEAIQRISKGLKSIDTRDIRFASIVEELGGFRQIGKVIPLIKQSALGVDALSVALKANDSLTSDAAIAQESLANKIAKVKEQFQDLVRQFADSEEFNKLTQFGLRLASAMIKVSESILPLLPLISSLVGVQVGKGLFSLLGSVSGLGGGSGRGVLGRNSGGPIPGSGNSDTVPAMLTPGEFVMRKEAVKRIGVSKLHAMNKGNAGSELDGVQYFAKGGTVQFSPKKNLFGGFLLKQLNQVGSNAYIDTDGHTLKAGDQISRDTSKRLIEKLAPLVIGSAFETPTGKISRTTNGPLTGLRDMADLTVKTKSQEEVAKALPKIQALAAVRLRSSNLGNEYEAVNSILNKVARTEYRKEGLTSSQIDKLKPNNVKTGEPGSANTVPLLPKAFTYRNVLQDRIGLTRKRETLAQQSEEKIFQAKQTDSPKGISKFKIVANGAIPALFPSGDGIKKGYGKQVQETLRTGVSDMISGFIGNVSSGSSGLFQLDKSKVAEATSDLLGNLSVNNAISGYMFEGLIQSVTGSKLQGQKAVFDFNPQEGGQDLNKLFGDHPALKTLIAADAKASLSAAKDIYTSKIPNFLAANGSPQNYIENIKYFNKGGLAKGTDTVPAMLTPGEFVINKRAAQAIGYDNLNGMNTQYFSGGGTVKDAKAASAINAQYNVGFSRKDAALISDANKKYAKATIEVVEELKKMGAEEAEIREALKVRARELNKGASVSDAKNSALQFTFSGNKDRSKTILAPREVEPGRGELRQQGSFRLDQNRIAQRLSQLGVAANDMARSMKAYLSEIDRGGTAQSALREAVIEAERAQRDRLKIEAQKLATTPNPGMFPTFTKAGAKVKGLFSRGPSGPVSPETRAIDDKISDFNSRLSRGALTLGLFTSSIATAASQSGLFSEEMAQSITRVTTTFATVFGIGSALVDSLSSLRSSTIANVVSENAETVANNAATASEVRKTGAASLGARASVAATGVTVGLAAGMAAAQYVASQYAQAQDRANASIKDFIKRLEDTGVGDPAELARQQKAALIGEAKSNAASSAGTKGAIAVGLAGAGIGSIVPGIGTLAGGVVGGIVGGLGGGLGASKIASNMADISDSASQAVDFSSQGQVAAIEAIYNFTKSVEVAELANLSTSDNLFRVTSATDDFVKSYKTAMDNLGKANGLRFFDAAKNSGGILTKEQEAQKLADQAAKSNAKQQAELVEKAIRDKITANSETLIGNNVKKSDLFKTLEPSLRQYKATLELTRPPEEMAEIYSALVRSISDASEASDTLRESQQRLNAAYKAQRDLIFAANSGLKALAASNDTSVIFENSMQNFIASLDGGTASFKLNISSGFADITKIPDINKFSSDVRNIATKMGPESQKMGESIIKSATFLEKAERTLLGKDLATLDTIGPNDTQRSVTNVVDDIFKEIGVLPEELGKAGEVIRERLKASIISKNGKGLIDPTLFREVMEPLIEQSQTQSAVFATLIQQESQKQVDLYAQALGALDSLMKREIEIRQGAVDAQQRTANNILDVNPNATAEQRQILNQNFRNARASIVTSRFGVNNPNDVGAISNRITANQQRMRQNQQEAVANATDALKIQELNNEYNNLNAQVVDATNRLKELANQSDRASDVMAKLDKARSARTQVTSQIEGFLLGGNKDRSEIQKNFMGLNQAFRQGSFQGLDEETRQGVAGLLNDLSDVKIGPRGETGKQIKEAILSRDFIRGGATPERAGKFAGKIATTAEQKIIAELRAISIEEQQASNALVLVNQDAVTTTKQLIDAIRANTVALNGKLEKAIAGADVVGRYMGGPVGNSGSRINKPKNGDSRLVAMQPGEYVITTAAHNKYGSEFLDKINSGTLDGFARGGRFKNRDTIASGNDIYKSKLMEYKDAREASIEQSRKTFQAARYQSTPTQSMFGANVFGSNDELDEMDKIMSESRASILKNSAQSASLMKSYKNPRPNSRPASDADAQTKAIAARQAEQKRMMAERLKNASGGAPITMATKQSTLSPDEVSAKLAAIEAKGQASRDNFNSQFKGPEPARQSRLVRSDNLKTFLEEDANVPTFKEIKAMQAAANPVAKQLGPRERSKPSAGDLRRKRIAAARKGNAPLRPSDLYGTKEQRQEQINKSRTAKREAYDTLQMQRSRGEAPEQLRSQLAAKGGINVPGGSVAQNGPQNAAGQQPLVNFNEGAQTLQAALDGALNRIPDLFKTTNDSLNNFAKNLEALSTKFNGMQMKHDINITGNIGITGINTEEIKTKIADAIKTEVGNIIISHINQSNKGLTAGGPKTIPPMGGSGKA